MGRDVTEDFKPFAPQAGPQTRFLSCDADVILYGGSAGGGKTFALLFEAARFIDVKNFGAVIFRRTRPEIVQQDGLWDESKKIYADLGGVANNSDNYWKFAKANSRISFSHLQHEKDAERHKGAQYSLICFDELTMFEESQFWYLFSRNRSVCGVRPYIRATTNPKPGWVADFIDWWIDEDGFAIPERSGVVRFFAKNGATVYWGDSYEEVYEQDKDFFAPELEAGMRIEDLVKSFTFIRSTVYDNQELLKANPGYISGLKAQSLVEKQRLLDGNWKIKASSGNVFRPEWFDIVDAAPALGKMVRFWDFAATEPSKKNKDPDWTVGVKVVEKGGVYYVADVKRVRATPGDVKKLVRRTAEEDGPRCHVAIEEEPGSSGKERTETYTREVLKGFICYADRATGPKPVRAEAPSASAQHGNVKVVRAPWNKTFFDELELFPDGPHDDQVDAFAGAFNRLATETKGERAARKMRNLAGT